MNVTKIMPHLIGKTYKEVVAALNIEENHGDCCGWAGHMVTDGVATVSEDATLHEVLEIDYDSSDNDSSRVVINFVFALNDGNDTGLILGYELSAGSGSGWSYGASCSLKYNNEEVATVSW